MTATASSTSNARASRPSGSSLNRRLPLSSKVSKHAPSTSASSARPNHRMRNSCLNRRLANRSRAIDLWDFGEESSSDESGADSEENDDMEPTSPIVSGPAADPVVTTDSETRAHLFLASVFDEMAPVAESDGHDSSNTEDCDDEQLSQVSDPAAMVDAPLATATSSASSPPHFSPPSSPRPLASPALAPLPHADGQVVAQKVQGNEDDRWVQDFQAMTVSSGAASVSTTPLPAASFSSPPSSPRPLASPALAPLPHADGQVVAQKAQGNEDDRWVQDFQAMTVSSGAASVSTTPLPAASFSSPPSSPRPLASSAVNPLPRADGQVVAQKAQDNEDDRWVQGLQAMVEPSVSALKAPFYAVLTPAAVQHSAALDDVSAVSALSPVSWPDSSPPASPTDALYDPLDEDVVMTEATPFVAFDPRDLDALMVEAPPLRPHRYARFCRMRQRQAYRPPPAKPHSGAGRHRLGLSPYFVYGHIKRVIPRAVCGFAPLSSDSARIAKKKRQCDRRPEKTNSTPTIAYTLSFLTIPSRRNKRATN
ncbi:hypothetical protein BCR43DRAFT_513678 [Syncephalastrum racemosum]|uniref:Uncharacterized protein n=1 Tax=Syncephalastrum racemosum TaxID=13706 RepID=A0A1X2HE98_SYNRA|nr:hypothetical protein BCR43DRAFT_513678 [Syncephalastrum racemosum]